MTPLLLVAALVAADRVADCRPRAPSTAAAYAPAGALALAGDYDLRLVPVTTRPGFDVRGRLQLLPADSVRRWTVAPLGGVGPRRPGPDRPLWGAAEVEGELYADLPTLARRDPDHPAAVLWADGRLLLAWAPPAIFHLELRVERVSASGFWGRWAARHGLQPRVFTGPYSGPDSGYFARPDRPTPARPAPNVSLQADKRSMDAATPQR